MSRRWSRPPATWLSSALGLCALASLALLRQTGFPSVGVWRTSNAPGLRASARRLDDRGIGGVHRAGSFDQQTRKLNASLSTNASLDTQGLIRDLNGTYSSHTSQHAAEHSKHDAAHGGHHKSDAFNPIIFFLVVYTVSACAQQAQRVLPSMMRYIPHTVLLFLIGMLMSFHEFQYGGGSEYREAIADFKHVDPHLIFWVLLPTLLYEDAAGADWHVVKRVMPNALLLALPGVILNTVLTAGIIVMWSGGKWSWEPSMLLGSILSATDPVAVVGALNSLQAPLKLSSLISGESLFNDGTAVALFQIFWDLTAGRTEFALGSSILKMIRLALGGPLFGFAIALVAYIWLTHTRSPNVEILVVVVCIFGCFFVAEHSEVAVSGVLAVVTFGFFMSSTGKYALEIEKEHEQHAIIEFLALLSNESIFVIGGLVAFDFLGGHFADIIQWKDVLDLLLLYVAIHVTRTLVIVFFLPLLKRWGYGLSWKEAVICVYGGLRGAVGLALGLLVISDSMIEHEFRVKIAFHVSGIVFLTLVINGTTVTYLYKWLEIASPERQDHHERLLKLGLEHADHEVRKHATMLKNHWFFFNCNVDVVNSLVPRLSDHVCFEDHDFFGMRKMNRKSDWVIAKAMDKLADSQAPNPMAGFQRADSGGISENKNRLHERYMSKVRYERGHSTVGSTSSNVFLFDSCIYNDSVAEMQESTIQFAIVHIGKRRDDLQFGGNLSVEDEFQASSRLRTKTFDGILEKVLIKSLIHAGIENSELKNTANMQGRSRAKQNWSVARDLGKAVCAFMKMLKKQSEEFGEIEKHEVLQEVVTAENGRGHVQNAREKNRFVAYKNLQQDDADIESLCNDTALKEEIYQTIVNVTRADYKAMYETQALSRGPYAVLMESIANQEEAIHGDFAAWRKNHFLVHRLGTEAAQMQPEETQADPIFEPIPHSTDWAKVLDKQVEAVGMSETAFTHDYIVRDSKARIVAYFPQDPFSSETGLPKEAFPLTVEKRELTATSSKPSISAIAKDKNLQKSMGFEVAYRFIEEYLYRPRSGVLNFIYWLIDGSKSLVFEWLLIRRNIEVLLAYVFTVDHILREVAVIPPVQAVCEKTLKRMKQKAKCGLLFKVMDMHPAMFFLYEHIVYAKLIVRYQHHLVHKLAEEGTLTEADAHHIIEHILRPTEKALHAYVPPKETLKKIYVQHAKKKLNTKYDGIVKLINKLVLSPFDD